MPRAKIGPSVFAQYPNVDEMLHRKFWGRPACNKTRWLILLHAVVSYVQETNNHLQKIRMALRTFSPPTVLPSVMSFSGHETFAFRYLWLKKGLDG